MALSMVDELLTHEFIAQLAEQLPFKEKVAGSLPAEFTLSLVNLINGKITQ